LKCISIKGRNPLTQACNVSVTQHSPLPDNLDLNRRKLNQRLGGVFALRFVIFSYVFFTDMGFICVDRMCLMIIYLCKYNFYKGSYITSFFLKSSNFKLITKLTHCNYMSFVCWVVKVVDFKPLAPHRYAFESQQGHWILLWAFLRNVGSSTQVLVHVWNNAHNGTWGFPLVYL
jgi:hypothetical protein